MNRFNTTTSTCLSPARPFSKLSPIAEMVAPSECAGCGRALPFAAVPLCVKCHQELFAPSARLASSSDRRCRRCFQRIDDSGNCLYCNSRLLFFDRHISLFPLHNKWLQIIHRWKFENERRVSRLLIEPIYEAVERVVGHQSQSAEGKSSWRVAFLASGRAGFDVRSYQPCGDLAFGVARRLGMEWLRGGELVKSKRKRQSSRSREERFLESHNSLRLRRRAKKRVKGSSYILIEDLFTTGATANEMARTLKQAGADQIVLVTLWLHESSD